MVNSSAANGLRVVRCSVSEIRLQEHFLNLPFRAPDFMDAEKPTSVEGIVSTPKLKEELLKIRSPYSGIERSSLGQIPLRILPVDRECTGLPLMKLRLSGRRNSFRWACEKVFWRLSKDERIGRLLEINEVCSYQTMILRWRKVALRNAGKLGRNSVMKIFPAVWLSSQCLFTANPTTTRVWRFGKIFITEFCQCFQHSKATFPAKNLRFGKKGLAFISRSDQIPHLFDKRQKFFTSSPKWIPSSRSTELHECKSSHSLSTGRSAEEFVSELLSIRSIMYLVWNSSSILKCWFILRRKLASPHPYKIRCAWM